VQGMNDVRREPLRSPRIEKEKAKEHAAIKHRHGITRGVSQLRKSPDMAARAFGEFVQIVDAARAARADDLLERKGFVKRGLVVMQRAIVVVAAVHERLQEVGLGIV